jgi:endoglucanase
MQSLTINGVNFTGQYVPSSSYPAKINGFWYVSYVGQFPWSHFEAK